VADGAIATAGARLASQNRKQRDDRRAAYSTDGRTCELTPGIAVLSRTSGKELAIFTVCWFGAGNFGTIIKAVHNSKKVRASSSRHVCANFSISTIFGF